MKLVLFIAIMGLFNHAALAQKAGTKMYLFEVMSTIKMCGRINFPAYLDSTLFARYLSWNLQSDSLPSIGKHAIGYTIEIWNIFSR